MDPTKYVHRTSFDDIIAPDGDVILVVAAEPQPKGRPQIPYTFAHLRVHSKVLRSASRVFDAMLGANWNEGQGLGTRKATNPRQVQLPDDDPDVMRVICSALHRPNDPPTEVLEAESVLKVAMHVDKYDLMDALRSASGHWLDHGSKYDVMEALKCEGEDWMAPLSAEKDMIQTGYMLVSALLFHDRERYVKISRSLVLEHIGSYEKLMEDEVIALFLPREAIDLLNERRFKTSVHMSEWWTYFAHWCRACRAGHMQNDKFKKLRKLYYDSRREPVPISDIIGEFKAVADPDWHDEISMKKRCLATKVMGTIYGDILIGDHIFLGDLKRIGLFSRYTRRPSASGPPSPPINREAMDFLP